jgi:hypothetical protein
MTILHWSPSDTRGDILAEALRPEAAEPVAVHVRPEVFARLGALPLREIAGLPTILLVVDDQLPRVPGYEVHRAAPPPPPGASPAARPAEDGDPLARDLGSPSPTPCTGGSWSPERRRGPRSREPRRLRVHALGVRPA